MNILFLLAVNTLLQYKDQLVNVVLKKKIALYCEDHTGHTNLPWAKSSSIIFMTVLHIKSVSRLFSVE